MVRLHKVLILILLLASIIACKKEIASEASSVSVETTGIREPVSIKVDGKDLNGSTVDLDEFVKGGDPKLIKVTIKNNSKYEIFDINLSFTSDQVTNYTFSVNELGLKQFPGKGGTCKRTLAKGKSCDIELQFTAITSGDIAQEIVVSYKNLLEEDEKRFNLTILSGTPASLLFEPNINNYNFGAPTGKALKPMIERHFRVTEMKELTIVNQGELRARDIKLTLNSACRSTFMNGLCPAGHTEAYRYENINCPKVLYTGESCKVNVYFTNLNQGDDISMKEITYNSTLKFDYKKDPHANKAALNGNFSVISTNIEARFESSLSNLAFEDELTVGNRDSRVFRVNNKGSREGILRKFVFYPNGSADATHYCVRKDSRYLNCYLYDGDEDETNDIASTLADLPFFLEDKEDCMSPANDITILDTTGCLFGLYFQPSVTKLVAGTENWDVKFEYDSRFLDDETIVMNPDMDFNTSGMYKSAARLEITDFKIKNLKVNFNKTDEDGIPGYNGGRWTLQQPTYYETDDYSITFTNKGDTPATNVIGKDGSGNIFNQDAIENLTGFVPSSYQELSFPSGSCAVIMKDQTCVLQFKLAVINRAPRQDIYDSLFDHYVEDMSPENYKQFIVSYHDGSIYTDSNISTTTQDVDDKEVSTKLYGIPVAAGKLSQYESIKLYENMTIGETVTRTFKVRNIGTADIPYIRSFGTASPLDEYNCTGAPDCPDVRDLDLFRWVPTDPSLLTTHNAIDCVDIINWQGQINYIDKGDLNELQTCLFTIEYQYKHKFYPSQENVDQSSNPLAVFWKKDLVDTQHMYSLGGLHVVSETRIAEFAWRYFNGDSSIPDEDLPASGYDANLTKEHKLGQPLEYWNTDSKPGTGYSTTAIVMSMPPHITPTIVRPLTSAILYREGFTRPALKNHKGDELALNPEKIFEPVMFYENLAFPLYDLSGASASMLDLYNEYTFSWRAAGVVAANTGQCADCDYEIHLGSFPAGVDINYGITFVSHRHNGGTLVEPIWSGSDKFTWTNLDTSLNDVMISLNSPANVAGVFKGSGNQTYSGILSYKVRNGMDKGDNYWTYKIYITANTVDDPPKISFSQSRYDVTTDPPNAPTVELSDTVTDINTFSYNNDHVNIGVYNDSNSVTLQMVKMEAINDASGFIQKRVYLKNTSGSKVMNGLKVYFRDTPTSVMPSNTSAIIGFSITENTCENISSLAVDEQCHIDLKFRPSIFSIQKEFYLTAAYEIEASRYVQQNIKVKLDPLSPSKLTMVGVGNPESVAIPGGVTQGYRINFNTIKLTSDPLITTYGPYSVVNDSAVLRASLLKAYQGIHGADASNPEDGSGKLFGGIEYFQIVDMDRAKVYANRDCFVGDDPVDIEEFDKGFISGDGCAFMIELVLTINNINKNLDKANAEEMDGFVVRIPYYSFQRINVDYLTFFFMGSIKPDDYEMVTPPFNIVGTDERRITFSFQQALPVNVGVGGIEGYRIYWATTSTALTNALVQTTNYLPDIMNSSSQVNVEFNSITAGPGNNIERGRFYYFKIVAIRKNPSYNAQAFQGLADGRYLSEGDFPIQRIMVPKTNYAYLHEYNAMVKKDVEGSGLANPMTWEDANSACAGQTTTFTDGIVKNRAHALMTIPIWQAVKSDPTASEYNGGSVNPLALPQWVGPSSYNIDTVLSSYIQNTPNNLSECFEEIKTCYLKCEGNCTPGTDRMIVGGFYGHPSAIDYTSYLGKDYPLGHPRCYLPVQP